MSALSESLWRCYTHPASAAASTESNTEGWRRQQTREGFATVTEAIRSPHLVDEAGYLTVEYDPVQETAHRVGRALHAIGDQALTDAVVTDVEAEIGAVENAELGDLTGRAAQAVVLSRTDASPSQVAAADAVLDKDPLGGSELFRELEPTAAAIAAAHWLKAAADVTSDLSGIPAEQVVAAADDIEALPYRTPTAVLGLYPFADSPRSIIVEMISDAMLIAEGLAPADLDLAPGDEEADDEDEPVRLTLLDPSRPARDLLEDLLIGIHACRLLYAEYTDADDLTDEDDDIEDDRRDEIDEAFRVAVRARAVQDRGRLL
ncbi:hypothetical protein [Actinoplanes sp. NPDC020271]|uniref:hypothetical protein n=1 Tax=Actinoplanes sp. NPDC020271 TaxID=3363896 RepID=UPI0037B27E31